MTEEENENTNTISDLILSELNYYNKINKLKYKIKDREKLAANS